MKDLVKISPLFGLIFVALLDRFFNIKTETAILSLSFLVVYTVILYVKDRTIVIHKNELYEADLIFRLIRTGTKFDVGMCTIINSDENIIKQSSGLTESEYENLADVLIEAEEYLKNKGYNTNYFQKWRE